MNKRRLGRTGIEVSEIAFGAVEIGMQYGDHPMPSEADAHQLLNAALDRGMNFIDTARMYGESEERIGRALKGRRQEAVIASKCVHLLNAEGHLPIKGKALKAKIEASLHESLQALQTDYIDVFMLHQANQEVLENETIAETFSQIKQSGKARAIGVSTYSVADTSKSIEKEIWDAIQLPFNVLDQSQRTCFDAAHASGVALIIRSVLFRGMLGGQKLSLHPALNSVEKQIDELKDFVAERYPNLPSLATKFALAYEEVSAVLVGIDKLEFLEAAIAVSQLPSLSLEDLKALEAKAYPKPEFLNLHQWMVNGWLS